MSLVPRLNRQGNLGRTTSRYRITTQADNSANLIVINDITLCR
jgi:hypothetical protein